ncbi:MAG: type II toxin-antitoxin system VapC family toxin [Acidobacteriota bacterium]
MILIDANVLMYAVGAEHPNKKRAVRLLQRVASGAIEATIDAEILQEILHRYRALNRWEDGKHAYDLARGIFPEVLPVTGEVMDRAKEIADQDERISARDAVHAAVLLVAGLEGICTFDHDFDRIKGCRRIAP